MGEDRAVFRVLEHHLLFDLKEVAHGGQLRLRPREADHPVMPFGERRGHRPRRVPLRIHGDEHGPDVQPRLPRQIGDLRHARQGDGTDRRAVGVAEEEKLIGAVRVRLRPLGAGLIGQCESAADICGKGRRIAI